MVIAARESMHVDDETLRVVPFFSELSARDLDDMRAFVRPRRVRKGAMLFFDGAAYEGMYVVLKGSVKVFKNTTGGKEYVVHIVQPSGVFADVPMFAGGAYPANACAMESSTVLFIPKRELLAYLDRRPALMRKMLVGFAKRMRDLVRQLEDITLHDVASRLARYLLREIAARGRADLPVPFLRLPVSKSDLAAHLGTAVETLSRTFHTLQAEGVLHVSQRVVSVENMPRLHELAS